MTTVDRRKDPEDRRKIERFTFPPVRSHFQQTRRLVLVLAAFGSIAGVWFLARGVYSGDPGAIALSLLPAILSFMLAFVFFRYGRTLKIYLDTESLGSLDRAMEAQASLWLIVVFMIVVYQAIVWLFG
jgi:hypothetical protein